MLVAGGGAGTRSNFGFRGRSWVDSNRSNQSRSPGEAERSRNGNGVGWEDQPCVDDGCDVPVFCRGWGHGSAQLDYEIARCLRS